jgi:TolB-like protein/Tfp pilus assembly protein PilF
VTADRDRLERVLGAGGIATVSLALLVLCTVTPMRLLAQCPDGSPPPCTRAALRPAIQPTSLAVLYFENASHDTTDAYLAEGITEEIISRLSEVGRLQVKSRYQVRRYRTDATTNAADIGRQLAVARIVTGSVRRAGNRVRVTAEMVGSTTGDVVWSERYDRADTDVLSLQEDLATAVATAITGRLLPAERQVLAAQPTRNPAAYDAYLLGRFYWNKRTAADLVAAAAHFEQAIRADSSYAQAWSGLADAYVLFLPAEYDVPGINPDSILNLAERAARRALALAPQLGEAYASLGEILEYRMQWVEARAAFERAVALSPLYPTAHLWYGYDLMVWNRWDEAVREMERAKQLDPLSVVTTVSLATAYDGAERRPEADAMFEQARQLAPDHGVVLYFASVHDLYRGDNENLAADFARLARSTGADSSAAAALERRLRDPAQRSAALRETIDGPGRVSWRALVYHALDGNDRMIQYLSEQVADPKRADFGSLLICGCLGSLRADPRMQAVLSRFGFPRP